MIYFLAEVIWYQELTQAEAAALLKVSERTIRRRWRFARVKVHEALKGVAPLPWENVEEKHDRGHPPQ